MKTRNYLKVLIISMFFMSPFSVSSAEAQVNSDVVEIVVGAMPEEVQLGIVYGCAWAVHLWGQIAVSDDKYWEEISDGLDCSEEYEAWKAAECQELIENLREIAKELGDLNLDGVVDASDLDLVRANWGSEVGAGGPGDSNGDGFVNSADMDAVRNNWGIELPYADLIGQ